MRSQRWFFAAVFMVSVFSNDVHAQQIQALPSGSAMQSSPQPQALQQSFPQQGQSFSTQPPSNLKSEALERREGVLQSIVPQAEERLSPFEQYLSDKTITITDTQFEILGKYGIAFSYNSRTRSGSISVPVRIVKRQDKVQGLIAPMDKNQGNTQDGTEAIDMDAGYLVGPPEVITEVFKILGIKNSLTVSTDLRQFGYDLFTLLPSTFAPVDKVPVGPNYVLGPGDEIKTTVWGKIEGQWKVVVDRDGNVTLPKVGVLGVAGLTFKELKEILNKEFSKYYTGFEMNVSMGALRSIRVYVVGNAERPGSYTVSSLSTLVNAIFEAGGPSKTGTMRDIQLKRNGKTLIHFDMYEFLLKGDKINDARLMPEDVIFIPPVGVLAAIAGSVNKPAIYELKGETKISQLIEMAGGLGTVAFKGRVQIDRIVDNSKQIVFESNLDDVRDKEMMLQSGDLVKIYQVVEDKRIVRLSGAVQREGEYGFNPGMTVKDLISMAGLKYYASDQTELARVNISQAGPQSERHVIDLSKAMEGNPQHNLTLEMNDYILVRPVPEWQLHKTVTISGEVKFPGAYTIMKGERLSSLIERAGGFTDKAYLPGAAFFRESVRDIQQKNMSDAIDRLEQQMLSQAAVSAQTALSAEEAVQQKAVAEQQKTIIAKMRAAKAQGRMVIRVDEVERLKDSAYNIELEDGDMLSIPERPNSIQVIGSVYNSTAFVYNPKATLSSYIDMAGGATKYAEEKDIFILKSDGSAVARRQGGMFFMSSRPEPGDTVVVPEKVEKIAWMREVKDLTQILYQIAVTAGVLIVAF